MLEVGSKSNAESDGEPNALAPVYCFLSACCVVSGVEYGVEVVPVEGVSNLRLRVDESSGVEGGEEAAEAAADAGGSATGSRGADRYTLSAICRQQ